MSLFKSQAEFDEWCRKKGRPNGPYQIANAIAPRPQSPPDRQEHIENRMKEAIDLTALPTTDEAKLNKTERAYLAYLRMLKVPLLNIQAITLKLADDCRFTADFTHLDENGRLTFVDVKGAKRKKDGTAGCWIEEDAKIKLKVAARKFPEFRFVVVFKDGSGWRVEDINP